MTTFAHPAHGQDSDTLQRVARNALGAVLYPQSLVRVEGGLLVLARRGAEKLLIVWPEKPGLAGAFSGQSLPSGDPANTVTLKACPLTGANARALRKCAPSTAPITLGREPSIGMGDRLGVATPGHIRALSAGSLRAVLAQQSVREMKRVGRTPAQVLDDASWGVFQAGFAGGYAADADHLKTTDDIDACVAAGFTMYTIDPSEHVWAGADRASVAQLAARYEVLPWDALGCSAADCRRAYSERVFKLDAPDGTLELRLSGEDLLRAAVKYGAAVAHVARMHAHLTQRMPAEAFDFEVSVDETDSPTSPAEHYYIAAELRRLGVCWTSLAPRLPGRFEKGVDFIGDVAQLRKALGAHAAIARAMGMYKLSLHSGSDKFSVYPAMAQACGSLVHVKTAGTSYLEALRAVATVDPELFREILAFSRGRYATDRATYFVSADPARAAVPERLADADLPGVLDDFHSRQICHVTYGSVLNERDGDGRPRFRERLMGRLREQEELYAGLLDAHYRRHIAPFC
jgi:hypothetical protein